MAVLDRGCSAPGFTAWRHPQASAVVRILGLHGTAPTSVRRPPGLITPTSGMGDKRETCERGLEEEPLGGGTERQVGVSCCTKTPPVISSFILQSEFACLLLPVFWHLMQSPDSHTLGSPRPHPRLPRPSTASPGAGDGAPTTPTAGGGRRRSRRASSQHHTPSPAAPASLKCRVSRLPFLTHPLCRSKSHPPRDTQRPHRTPLPHANAFTSPSSARPPMLFPLLPLPFPPCWVLRRGGVFRPSAVFQRDGSAGS